MSHSDSLSMPWCIPRINFSYPSHPRINTMAWTGVRQICLNPDTKPPLSTSIWGMRQQQKCNLRWNSCQLSPFTVHLLLFSFRININLLMIVQKIKILKTKTRRSKQYLPNSKHVNSENRIMTMAYQLNNTFICDASQTPQWYGCEIADTLCRRYSEKSSVSYLATPTASWSENTEDKQMLRILDISSF